LCKKLTVLRSDPDATFLGIINAVRPGDEGGGVAGSAPPGKLSLSARVANLWRRLIGKPNQPAPGLPPYNPEAPPPPPPKDEKWRRLQAMQEARLNRIAHESLDMAAQGLYWEQETARQLEGLERGMPFLSTNVWQCGRSFDSVFVAIF